MSFPPRLTNLVDKLKGSTYLTNLHKNPREQHLKNGATCATVSDLSQLYGRRCGYLTAEEKQVVRSAIDNLYERYPHLPRTEIHYVVVHEESQLEFGNTSFTVNDVVFLHPSATRDPEIIQHETVHVLQRLFPEVFERAYTSLGYRRATQTDLQRVKTILQKCSTVVVDNPDESVLSGKLYIDSQDRTVCYNSKLDKVMVDLARGTCSKLREGTTESMFNHSVSKDSLSEMFAVLVTRDDHASDPLLRQKVNDLLRGVAE